MTVPATPRRAGPYDGTGAQTAFPFSFKAFDESDVRVVELDVPTNVESDATLNTDYTVALNPDQESTPGGTVNYLAAPSASKKITLIGDLPYEQPADLPDGGAYRAQQVEDALDRLAICMQQLKEITDRCAQVPVSSADASSLIDSINVLSANLATLQTVVANIADLLTLANDIAAVNTLAAISAQLQTVAAIAVQVVAVAAIAPEIVAVEGISSEVVTVATNMAAILAAVADLPALAGKANSGPIGTSLLTMNTARMLGRMTAGTGAPEELTAAQVTSDFVAAASDTAAGKVELATDTEARGTGTNRALVPANLEATALGRGQTWQDVTASRLAGTTYTNSTGRPIAIRVRNSAALANMSVTIGGVSLGANTNNNTGAYVLEEHVVPVGATYSVAVASGGISSWHELR